ncbi:MAG: rhodanese-like domain-containing protein [Rhodospirillaceae bacterium]|nr:rhodanese-like domain-containing protein [Rhodospirillaceae bacterium]
MDRLVEFADNNSLLVVALLVSWVGVIFYEIKRKATLITQVSTTDAVRLINNGAIIIDVRPIDHYQEGHIVNSKNIALDNIQRDKNIPKKKNKPLLTVCENGINSGKAANLLRQAGFESVFSLKGGLKQWRTDSMTLVK